jgi:hypothetical protein
MNPEHRIERSDSRVAHLAAITNVVVVAIMEALQRSCRATDFKLRGHHVEKLIIAALAREQNHVVAILIVLFSDLVQLLVELLDAGSVVASTRVAGGFRLPVL